MFGTVDSWLIYSLTGRHETDATNASRTLLFNIHEGRWDTETAGASSGSRHPSFPEVKPSSADFGSHQERAFRTWKFPSLGCAGDQQAALFGHACFKPGSAKNTYGTGCFTLMNTGSTARRIPA